MCAFTALRAFRVMLGCCEGRVGRGDIAITDLLTNAISATILP